MITIRLLFTLCVSACFGLAAGRAQTVGNSSTPASSSAGSAASVTPTGPVAPARPDRRSIVIPADVAALAATVPAMASSTPAGAAPVAKGKSKKPPVPTSGTWKWTTFNRSMQPIENTLTLSVDKKGNVSGTLADRTGVHPIQNAAVTDAAVSFDLVSHSRGAGDLKHSFTVSRDPDSPSVAVDEPDFSPLGKANGGKRHHETKAKHDAGN